MKDKAGNAASDGVAWTGQLIRTHLLVGWWSLLIFLSLGIVLELLHAFKLPAYLDTRNTTRRLMWTLAHSHGTLFSLIHIGFAATLAAVMHVTGNGPQRLGGEGYSPLRWASRLLTAGLVTMPLGFFLGGVDLHGGDPGIGIVLAPLGAGFLLAGVGCTILALRTMWTGWDDRSLQAVGAPGPGGNRGGDGLGRRSAQKS